MQLTSPLVDAHAHIFTHDMPLIDNPRHRPGYDFTLTDYLEQLDMHGVHYGVIAAASPWGDYNNYTIESVRGNTRLRGTVILDPHRQYNLKAMNRGKTWLKASCAYRIGPRAQEHLLGYLNRVDPSRLFWASDCPFVGHESKVTYLDTINWLATLVSDPRLRTMLFADNAYRFYFSRP